MSLEEGGMRRNDEDVVGSHHGRHANAGLVRVIEKKGERLEGIVPYPGFPNVKRHRFLTEIEDESELSRINGN